MEAKLEELKSRLLEVNDLISATNILNWDQATYMPPAGAPARARQMALLQTLAHTRSTDPELGKLLDALQPYADSLPPDSDDAALIRLSRRNYERSTKVPVELMAAFSNHSALSYQAWTEARPQNDFKKMQPYLEKTLELSRKIADCFPGYEHIADPLIDQADYGMKATSIRALFADLRAALVPIVEKITSQPPTDDSCITQYFPEDKQLAFGLEVIKHYGYDFRRGRQDKTHHPFMIRFSAGDTRITTRVKEHDLGDALFSTLHEAGHALYELGIREDYDGLPLGEGASAGMHESQSRLWENQVGRSLPFWEYFYPKLQATFPEQLGKVPLDSFYRAINKVQRSLIRVDADEVTYNLHVMIRFDLELALLEGSLAVKDLPEAWHARYQSDLGVVAPDDRDGVLQDVHWYAATIGGVFQGYTLGNLLSAQFYALALQAQPEIIDEMRRGTFSTLHNWLKTHIYQHGSKYPAPELVQKVTGGPMTIAPYVAYLHNKYGQLYSL